MCPDISRHPLPRPRVLVVDDQPAVARAVAWALRSAGAEPVIAPQPWDALALLADDGAFDVVLTDYDLGDPLLTGAALLGGLLGEFGADAGPLRVLMSAAVVPDLAGLEARRFVEVFLDKGAIKPAALLAMLARRRPRP